MMAVRDTDGTRPLASYRVYPWMIYRNKYCFSILFWQWSMDSFFCDMDAPAAQTNMECTCWLLRDTQLLLLIFGSEKVQTAWLFFVI